MADELLFPDGAELNDLQLHRIGRILQDLAIDEKRLVVGHFGRIDEQEAVFACDEELLVASHLKAAASLDLKPEDRHTGVPYGFPQRFGLEACGSRVGYGNLLFLHADCDLVNAIQASYGDLHDRRTGRSGDAFGVGDRFLDLRRGRKAQ